MVDTGEIHRAPLLKRIIKLEAQLADQYKRGFEDGLRTFAWWKDGVEQVGSCGTTLKQALVEVEGLSNFCSPSDEEGK